MNVLDVRVQVAHPVQEGEHKVQPQVLPCTSHPAHWTAEGLFSCVNSHVHDQFLFGDELLAALITLMIPPLGSLVCLLA